MKVQEIFDIAIRLLDEQHESSGSTDTPDTKLYAMRTPSLLNSLLDRCMDASASFRSFAPGQRPICPKVFRMEDDVELDERICSGVLPYGLAGLLILTDGNDGLSNFFLDSFRENLYAAMGSLPCEEAPVVDVYDCLSGM